MILINISYNSSYASGRYLTYNMRALRQKPGQTVKINRAEGLRYKVFYDTVSEEMAEGKLLLFKQISTLLLDKKI